MKTAVRFFTTRDIPQDAAESRIIPFVISDETRDRHGTILDAAGWELDAYNQNGIVGYQHNVYGGSICEGPEPDYVIGKGVAKQEGGQLIGTATFEPADINELAEKIFRKVLFGSLRSTSVGFNELDPGKYGTGPEAQGAANETYYFGRRELLEFSIVNIPSNRNTQARAMRDQTAGALAYVARHLGDRFRMSQIEQMRVCDVMDLLEGKDLEIRSTDPDEVRRLLEQIRLKDLQIERLKKLQLK